MSTHTLVRTSPFGEPFVGECIKCGESGLGSGAALEQCDNFRMLGDDEALLEAIEGQSEEESP